MCEIDGCVWRLLHWFRRCCVSTATAPARRAGENEAPVKIVQPAVDKQKSQVTIPGAFLARGSGRLGGGGAVGPAFGFFARNGLERDDHAHALEQACRDAGFHDADAWTTSVKDFPRVRGDRMLITASFTADGKAQTYSLDELLAFQNWNARSARMASCSAAIPGEGGGRNGQRHLGAGWRGDASKILPTIRRFR